MEDMIRELIVLEEPSLLPRCSSWFDLCPSGEMLTQITSLGGRDEVESIEDVE